MNIKRGLIRVWIVVSVFWVLHLLVVFTNNTEVIFSYVNLPHWESLVALLFSSLGIFWGVLYVGFWIGSGFSGDDKKKGETNE